MRVLFTCHGAAPHLYPMVPLAWALRTAGHEVRIASQTRILDQIVHTGLPAVEIAGAPQWTEAERRETITAIYTQGPWPVDWGLDPAALSDEQRTYLEFIGRRMLRTAEAMVDELTAFALRWRPELIVYDAICFAGAVVAARLGVPGVRHLCGTVAMPRIELTASGEPLPEYVRLFEARGLPVVLTADAVVDPTPVSMRLHSDPSWLGMRYVPYNGPGIAPGWAGAPAGRPRVCVTWGHTAATALGQAAVKPFRDAIDAITELDVDILAVSTAEQLEQLGALPAGARAAASVPLHRILTGCDVLVQQGGDGTTLTGAALGVPQLAISRKPDAEVAPGRLAGVGAGIHLRHQELRDDPAAAQVVRDAVAKLLADPGYRDAARRLRAEIERQPPPAALVSVLERTTVR